MVGKPLETMETLTFGLGTTTGTSSGNHWETMERQMDQSAGQKSLQARETSGNHGWINREAENHHRDRLGKPWETVGNEG